MAYQRFVPPSDADPYPLRKFMRDIIPLLGLGLAILLWLLLRPQAATKVIIDITVSSVGWKNVEEAGKDPDRYGFELLSNDSSTFVLPPATITFNNSGHPLDGAALVLLPLKPYRPVQLRGLLFPDQASIRLTQPDSARLLLSVSAAPTADKGAWLRWQQVLQRRGYVTPAGCLDTVGSADGSAELTLEKSLASGEAYTFEFIRPRSWKGPYRLVASSLVFTEPDVRETEAISSVLGGTVKLLEISDPPIVLAERDMLSVRFEQPVELFLRGTPAGIQVHAEGAANRIWCGPRIMGDKNDQMPLVISTYRNITSYLAALLGALIGLLPMLLEILKANPKPKHS